MALECLFFVENLIFACKFKVLGSFSTPFSTQNFYI